jgi:serine phosphatase RsbU (regulator of sigma subunit)
VKLQLNATLEGQRRSWPLEGDVVTIGRSSRSTVPVADGTVSKQHAEIFRAGEDWCVRDLGSRNGTRVNGHEVREPHPLRDGDILEVGKVIIQVGTETVAAPAMTQYLPRDPGSSLKLRAHDILHRTAGPDPELGRAFPMLLELEQIQLSKDKAALCEDLLKLVEKHVPATRFLILLRDENDPELRQIAARYRGGGRAGDQLKISRGILDTVLQEQTSVMTSDALSDERFKGRESIIMSGVHSAMAVPILDTVRNRVMGVMYLDSNSPAMMFDEPQLKLLTVLANSAAMRLRDWEGQELRARQARIEAEVSAAMRIQRGLLPPTPDGVAGWRFHARVETCYEVGGDLYDFHRRSDGKLVFLVGDVSGKGFGAAMLMSSVQSLARALYESCESPAVLIERMNSTVHRQTDPGHFVTVFLGCVDLQSGVVHYVNAGHNPPLVVSKNGVRLLETGGVPVGILPSYPFEQGEARIEPGETLVAFSDGIPEAQHGDEFFGEERLQEVLLELAGEADIDKMGDSVVARVDQFIAEEHRSDDVTLLLIRRD